MAGVPVYVSIGGVALPGLPEEQCRRALGGPIRQRRREIPSGGDRRRGRQARRQWDVRAGFFPGPAGCAGSVLGFGSSTLAGARDPASYTVRDCLDDYFSGKGSAWRSAADARSRANALIVPKLGYRAVTRLTSEELRDWLQDLAAQPRRLRSRKGQPTRFARLDTAEAESVRKRQASANRTLTILKAALNHAFRGGDVPDDRAWRRVQPFRGGKRGPNSLLDR